MHKKVLFILLFLPTSWASCQIALDETSKEAINLHIEYINHCSLYVDATQQSLKKFNTTLNSYAEWLDKEEVINHEALQLSYGREIVDFQEQLGIIAQKSDSLILARQNLPADISKRLENELKHYQKVFGQIKSIVNELTSFTGNKAIFFEDIRFKRAYSLLYAYEKNLAVLAVLNYSFDITITELFGKEKLPKALNKAKNLVLLSKKVIFELRQGHIVKLEKSMGNWLEQYNTSITLDDRKNLEIFGDFPYLDMDNVDERESIDQHAKLIYSWADRYLKGKDVFKVDEAYDRAYQFEELLIDIFNSQGIGIAQKYNQYIERAEKPILKIVNEVPPFRVIYPDKIRLAEQSASWVSSEGIKILLFDANDISTLDGALSNNLVLLLDVSISMRYDNKLNKLKNSIAYLIDILREQDKLTVVTYSGKAKKVVETVSNYDKNALKEKIFELKSEGKSNGKAGLQMAYREVENNYVVGGNNRIVIASDGMFKIDKQLKSLIREKLKKDIFLTTFKYRSEQTNKKKKDVLKSLSELGGGHHVEIKEEADAIKALVTESKQAYKKDGYGG